MAIDFPSPATEGQTFTASNGVSYTFTSGAWVSSALAQGVNTQTGTAYTLGLSDKGAIVEMNNAAANVVTIPPNASVAFPIGTIINITQLGAGVTTLSAAAGVTLNGVVAGSCALSYQYAGVTLYQRATDVWVVEGAQGGVS